MKHSRLLTLIILGIFTLTLAENALAGFGISPPYVQNESLARNTRYEQKIILVRGDPVDDLMAKATIEVPGAEGWITIDKGGEFLLPKGEKQVPIVVNVNIPTDAEFRTYKGNIRIVLSPATPPQAGTVGIALGARIDVRLTVVDEIIFEFVIREISVENLEEGRTWWGLFFPGKIRLTMQVENTGNVPAGPTGVQFDIYDSKGVNLLESVKNTNKIKTVEPFTIGNVVAELPTRLKPGSYSVRYKVFKGDEIAQEGEMGLGILPRGAIPGYEGYGFIGLSAGDKAKVISVGGGILLILAGLCWLAFRWKRSSKKK